MLIKGNNMVSKSGKLMRRTADADQKSSGTGIIFVVIEEVIPKERKDQYYDYSEVIEIDLILEEYFHAA